MKRLMLASVFVLFATEANAQIVLNPPSAAGYVRFGSTWSSDTSTAHQVHHIQTNHIRVGVSSGHITCYVDASIHGIMEFDLEGLPTASMTESNFAARLEGFDIKDHYQHGDAAMTISLFDLSDNQEDNAITLSDFDKAIGESLATSPHDPPDIVASFDSVDVTEVIRRDLFGEGTAGDTAGFILTATGFGIIDARFFNESPRITIVVEAGNTDSDADSDADSDSDADIDSDEDSDGNVSDISEGDCMCDSLGQSRKSLLSFLGRLV